MEIIVKKYEHINSSLPNWDTPRGKYISTKKQYFNELKKGGYVPYEEGQRLSESKNYEKKYTPSKDCLEMMRTVIDKKKDKTIVLGHYPKIVEGMKKMGMRFDIPDPKHHKD